MASISNAFHTLLPSNASESGVAFVVVRVAEESAAARLVPSVARDGCASPPPPPPPPLEKKEEMLPTIIKHKLSKKERKPLTKTSAVSTTECAPRRTEHALTPHSNAADHSKIQSKNYKIKN